MRSLLRVLAICLCVTPILRGAEKPRLVGEVTPLPFALSDDFAFRKTKLFFMGTSAAGPLGGLGALARSRSRDTSINFERSYRLFGALTRYDQSQRMGNYFDFFWRAKRRAEITVRLEYRQERLRSFVQARELFYPNARGNHKTEFRVIGDDYLEEGRVSAWRCLLIEQGRIVAQTRSYLWE